MLTLPNSPTPAAVFEAVFAGVYTFVVVSESALSSIDMYRNSSAETLPSSNQGDKQRAYTCYLAANDSALPHSSPATGLAMR